MSVCIANWNCRDHLRDCLRSLLDHDQGLRLEVIVVDNGSSDGSAELMVQEFPAARVVCNHTNLGFATANNQAAGLARGRYLLFLNNDTLVPPDTLRQLVDFAEAHPEAGIIAPRLRDGRGRVQLSCRRRPTVGALLHRTVLFRWTGLFRRAYRDYRWREADTDATRMVDVVMGAAMLIRRDRFLAAGGWDEAFTFGGEDIDLCTRIGKQYSVVYHSDVEIVHFGRVSSRKHPGFAHTNTLIGMIRFLRKHGTSRRALFGYKLAMTLDAPLQWLGQAVQCLWRRMRGRRTARNVLAMRGIGHFLRHGLWEFWRT